MEKDGGWLFLSHSHQDIEVVREIRNQFERLEFQPLMFYLRCLNDDEIESLIKREISEREWFVYVQSENAKKSKWVRSELAYISSFPNKKVFTIDIAQDITEQVEKIAKRLKVFINE